MTVGVVSQSLKTSSVHFRSNLPLKRHKEWGDGLSGGLCFHGFIQFHTQGAIYQEKGYGNNCSFVIKRYSRWFFVMNFSSRSMAVAAMIASGMANP